MVHPHSSEGLSSERHSCDSICALLMSNASTPQFSPGGGDGGRRSSLMITRDESLDIRLPHYTTRGKRSEILFSSYNRHQQTLTGRRKIDAFTSCDWQTQPLIIHTGSNDEPLEPQLSPLETAATTREISYA